MRSQSTGPTDAAAPAARPPLGAAAFVQSFFDRAPIGVGLTRQGRIVYCNPALQSLLGYSAEELAGMDFTEYTHPDDIPMGHTPEGDLSPNERDYWRQEKRYLTKDGRVLWARIVLYGLPESMLEEPFSLLMVEDITEHRRAEEALRQSEARQRESQKMEAIGRLAGGIAHDFNNLLTTIIGYSDLMMSDLEFEKTVWFEDVREIKAAAERAGGLTQQILAFSRRQRLQTEVVSVNSLVMEIAPLLRRTLGEDIELVTHLEPDIGLVGVDPQQFTQALMNLALNSRDAMPSGGQITFRTDNTWLDEASPAKDPDLVPGWYVRVAVSDTGVGIEPSQMPLIYEPFYTTKPLGQGAGLGLPTVYGVVKQSGGAIVVDSILGEGTTFQIFLPQVEDAPSRQSPIAGATDQSASAEAPVQHRVLLVEDEEAVRRLTERILRQLGCAVETAATGMEALAILQADQDSRIDLLLTDVVLPGGIDGGEIARRARALRHDLAVLYVSGYSRNVILDSGSAEEEVHYLEKPFTAEQLALKVHDALAAKGLRGSLGTR